MEPPFHYQWSTRKQERYKLAEKERKKKRMKRKKIKERNKALFNILLQFKKPT